MRAIPTISTPTCSSPTLTRSGADESVTWADHIEPHRQRPPVPVTSSTWTSPSPRPKSGSGRPPGSRSTRPGSPRETAPAMASQRTWFHLVYRLLIRLYQGISVGARPGAPLWLRWAAPAFAVGDVASGVALWRTPGLALAPRLAADSADTTFWSFVSPGV